MNRFIDQPPTGSEGWQEVWSDDLRYKPEASPSLLHRMVRAFITPLVRRAGRADQERQRNFNLALLELLRDVRNDVTAVSRDLATVNADLLAEIRRIQEILPIAVQRNDALIAAVDQKLESLAARLRDLSTPLLRAEGSASLRGDFVYRRLEEGLRGSEAEVRTALMPYLDLAEKHAPAVDVGCGRGEFLHLARQRGIPVRGFDTNERSVADLKQQGFAVELGGVPGCFDTFAEGSIGSIFASHVVEHLPADVLTDFFSAASRVLRQGGLLMIETPNAESMKMAASDFWRDPTHVAPRHAGALVLLAREFGFSVEEAAKVAPYPEANRFEMAPEASKHLHLLVEGLNALLFGNQNLRLVLRKQA